jgi:hypothetical protein
MYYCSMLFGIKVMEDILLPKQTVEICMQNTLILLYQVNPKWVTLLEYIYNYIQVLTILF